MFLIAGKTAGLMKYLILKCPLFKCRHDQIDSSTIDGNEEFVHSQYSCILTSQVSIQFLQNNQQ